MHHLRRHLKSSVRGFQDGPYWDHILGYWKASLETPERILFLKYEDLKRTPTSNVKRLADFIGYPFLVNEEKAGVPGGGSLENRLYYRKAKDGDWQNYFTDEMKEKIDKLMDEKLGDTGLVLK
ncbi:putative quercetin-3-sulfate 4'-sulfotransferase [Helianthus debilis subsp. tardiflorus]